MQTLKKHAKQQQHKGSKIHTLQTFSLRLPFFANPSPHHMQRKSNQVVLAQKKQMHKALLLLLLPLFQTVVPVVRARTGTRVEARSVFLQ